MSRKWKKRVDGAISLMLVAILLPTMLLSGLMVDLSRYSMAKALISSAGDLTLNAALADYDGILQDVYGLFAVSQDDDELYANLSDYFKTTLVSGGVVSEAESDDYVTTLLDNIAQYLYIGESGEANIVNLFDMDIQTDSAVSGVEDSTLENEEILKKQIVEYMKYRAPINCALSFFSGLQALGKSGKQADIIETKLEAETYTQTVADTAKEVYIAIKKYDEDLYKAKEFSTEYGNPRGTTEKDENDTEKLPMLVNAERVDSPYNYRLANCYILGFLLDTEQSDVTDGGHTVKNGNGESLIKSSQTVEQVAAKLHSATADYDQCRNVLECEEYSELYSVVEAITIETAGYENAIRLAVRNNLQDAMTMYKKCFVFLRDANKEDSASKRMVQSYKWFLDKKVVFEKTYSDTLKRRESLEQKKQNTENDIKQCEQDIADYETGIKNCQAAIEEVKNGKDKNVVKKEKIEGLESDIEWYENAIEQKNQEIANLRNKVAALENDIGTLTTAINKVPGDLGGLKYKSDEGKFEDFEIEEKASAAIEGMYQMYLKYTWYRDEARVYTELLVKGIYGESRYIYDKTTTLHEDMKDIADKLDKLLQSVDTYGTKLDAWEQANKDYVKNGEDQFGASNGEEIKAGRKSYDKAQIEEVKTFNQQQLAKLIPFWNYIQGDGSEGNRYGGTFFWKMDEARDAINAVRSASDEFVNKETVTVEECNAKFAELCKEIPYGYNYSETNTHLGSYTHEDFQDNSEKKETILPFVGYLMCTYPDTKGANGEQYTLKVQEEASEEEQDAKNMYDSLKSSVKEKDKETSDPNTDKYGYSYMGKSTPGNAQAKTADTKVDADNATGAFSGKKEESAGLLAGLEDALTAGRDNIYVMEYIFGNFSYNTMVQDAAYDDYVAKGNNKAEFYATTLSGGIDYKPFMALTAEENTTVKEDAHSATRPTTLSGYPIAEYNNEFYGAEVEYLLYGCKSADNNVTSADASIFAIRFILNSVYAFSNSEIRNTTRTAGLAVQAASLGTVPYQVVMVVLQLALAVSESMLDISVMHTGAKVAIVPTKDTWMLSPSGAGNLLKDVAAAKAKEVVNDAVDAALDQVSTGIQDFVDCSAEEIEKKTRELIEGLTSTAEAKATELMDQVFAKIEETLMTELNKMRYLDADTSPQDALATVFDKARQSKEEALQSMLGAGGEVGTVIADTLSTQLDELITELESTANSELTARMGEHAGQSPASYVTSLCNTLQSQISEMVRQKIDNVADMVEGQVRGMTSSLASEINTLASQKTEEAKEQIIAKANGFIDEKVNTITDKMPDLTGLSSKNRTVSGSGSVASALAFGYSDYLRVFLFLGLCGNNKAILNRTAKLIESNINYPSKRMAGIEESGKSQGWFSEMFQKISWFFTKKDSGKGDGEDGKDSGNDQWQVSKTYTYVKIDADIEMKMFFLNTDLFSSMINLAYLEEGENQPDTRTVTTYHYHSVMGY